jgi:hypothetical protein
MQAYGDEYAPRGAAQQALGILPLPAMPGLLAGKLAQIGRPIVSVVVPFEQLEAGTVYVG